MSRIGKHPAAIPDGVEVQLSGRTLSAKGSLGTLRLMVSNEVDAAIADGRQIARERDKAVACDVGNDARASEQHGDRCFEGVLASPLKSRCRVSAAVQGSAVNLHSAIVTTSPIRSRRMLRSPAKDRP